MTYPINADQIQEEDVCVGAIQSQGPIIANALRSMTVSSRSSALFCSTVFGLCTIPPVPHYALPLPKPVRNNISEPISGQRPPIPFVHVTDLHVDSEYVVGSNARCNKPLCCRGEPVGPLGRHPAGPFGDHQCDTPVALLDSMLDAVKAFAPDAQGLFYTGDAIDHSVWLSTRPKVEDAVRLAYDRLDTLGIPVYGAVGNHDVHPVNSFPRRSSRLGHQSDWTYDLHADVWKSHIGDAAAKESRKHLSGSYSVPHAPGLRIISINTNYAYKSNFWVYDSDVYEPDSQGLYKWLIDELQHAETHGERVWLIGHMSSGGSDYMQDQSAIFDQIVQRYHKTIAASFYGHSHDAKFELGYSSYAMRDASTATSVSYIAPALTPSSGNPAFRIYYIDPDSYAVMDFVDLHADMADPGFQTKPHWKPFYSARDAYGKLLFDRPLSAAEPLSPAFWHRVTEAFEHDAEAFEAFLFRRLAGVRTPKCRSELCKKLWIEALRAARSEYNGDALLNNHRSQGASWKRSLDPDEEEQARLLHLDHDDLPGMSSCSMHSHSAAKLLKSMGSVEGGKKLVVQSAQRRTRRAIDWIRGSTTRLFQLD